METSKEFEAIEQNATDAPVENIKWYGKEEQTDTTSIHDVGKGEEVVVRLYEYKLKPGIEKLPTKEEILTPEYIKHIKTLLWADGLRLVMEPRLHITKEKCLVFAPAQAATGHSFLEKPKLLQEWI